MNPNVFVTNAGTMSRYSRFAIGCAAWCGLAFAAATGVAGPVITYETVPVGNVGNAANGAGLGAVNYEYAIGKYEVTIGQYAAFLNAVAKFDSYGLYDTNMGGNQRFAGISRAGSQGSYVYTVTGPLGTNPAGAESAANRPITYATWFRAARFANWMSNGQPTGDQDLGTTESGAYFLDGAVSGDAPGRTPGATFYIPTDSEWIKAGFYDPTKDGTGGYWTYSTGRMVNGAYVGPGTAPGNGWDGVTALANKDEPNQANWALGNLVTTRIYAVVGSNTLPSTAGNQNVLTNVGAYSESYSFYGAYDMTGNMMEWTTPDDVSQAAATLTLRGGSFNSTTATALTLTSTSAPSGVNFGTSGFRLVAIVPEPSTWALAAAGLALAAAANVRRRRARSPVAFRP